MISAFVTVDGLLSTITSTSSASWNSGSKGPVATQVEVIVQVPLFIDDLADGTTIDGIHATLVQHYDGQDIVSVVPLAESAALGRIDAEERAGGGAGLARSGSGKG